MKLCFVLGLTLCSTREVEAQVRAQSFVPTPMAAPRASVPQRAGALGNLPASNASTRPLGGVALPIFPGNTPRRARRNTPSPHYIGPVYYVPNAYDSAGYDYPPLPSEDSVAPPPPRRVAVNQYLTSGRSDSPAPAAALEAPLNPGDPIGPTENYYLIAYKDHTIYSALAYWVEGETLHYVTTQNTHNQASLPLIDLDQTTKLNADRAVPFSLTGK